MVGHGDNWSKLCNTLCMVEPTFKDEQNMMMMMMMMMMVMMMLMMMMILFTKSGNVGILPGEGSRRVIIGLDWLCQSLITQINTLGEGALSYICNK